ncbi:MAG: creatininase family protein [Armatimonadota bacterium]
MRWLELTTTEMEAARGRADGVALIPVGSIETHGPHLPVGCDALVAERTAELVAEEEAVVVLPVLSYTWSPQARRHPGAITIEATHLVHLMEDLCDEIHRNGFTKIVLLHAHGGNVPLDYLMPAHMVERGKPYAVYCIGPWAGLDGEILSRERERAPIGHACHVETSSLMYVRPELAKLGNLEGEDISPREGPQVGAAQTGIGWIEKFRYGVIGRPELATRELGEELIRGWARGVADIIRKIKADEVTLRVVREFARS